MVRKDILTCELFERTVVGGDDQQDRAGEIQWLRRFSNGVWEMYSDTGGWYTVEQSRWKYLDFDRQSMCVGHIHPTGGEQ